MKLIKEKFFKTELGLNLLECITAWDKALIQQRKYSGLTEFRDEYRRARKTVEWCNAQWKVYQLVLKQFYNLECHFSDIDRYFGIVTDDGGFLFKHEKEA